MAGSKVPTFDCQRFELLRQCRLSGSYGFAGVSRKEDVIQLTSSDELSANLPLSGAKLGAQLERGVSIDLALITIGRKASTLEAASRHELLGDCRGASHFVRAVLPTGQAAGGGTGMATGKRRAKRP